MDSARSEMEVVAGLIQKLVDENASRKMDQMDYRKKYEGLVNRYTALESRLESLKRERESREDLKTNAGFIILAVRVSGKPDILTAVLCSRTRGKPRS